MTFGLGLFVFGVIMLYAAAKDTSIAQALSGTVGAGIAPFKSSATTVAAGASPVSGGGAMGAPAAGAKGIVEAAVAAAAPFGTYVGSALRPGSTVSGGGMSDHATDNSSRAARDIGVQGLNLLTGPPSPRLDDAVVAIGKLFGKTYHGGVRIVDTFNWKGYRIQIIWRTPAYGGHMGHIHIGARAL